MISHQTPTHMKITLERTYLKTVTFGVWMHDGKDICKTMELPWKENRQNISCIPEGNYWVKKCPPTEKRPYEYLRFLNVPGRDGILVHRITWVKDLRGCIGVGKILLPTPNPENRKMLESGKALTELINILPSQFMIQIMEKANHILNDPQS